ncbi:hypothetical protein [uncultured Holdemanella sp.]|uniref:hypothetical protein n=1 Tax=uncultured Holdemanella sp. TaxID=1763549 RepID=UPI0025E39816|nr:hypothetical protein [uncultured Holdemanella sp.]
MQKNLKRASAMILSLAMAVQFGLTDSYYIKANDEQPVEETKQENEASKSNVKDKDASNEDSANTHKAEEKSTNEKSDAEEATTNSDETATSFSMMLAENANDTYGVELRSQNNSSLGTLSLNVGAITDNFKDGKITLNDKTYSFVEARVIKKSNPTDYTPISYVAVYNGVTYYSTNSITGSPLEVEAGESIVVILKEDVTQYTVNYKLIVDDVDRTANISDYITLEGNETLVDTATSFSFLVKPKKGFTVTSVKQDDTKLTADGTKYSTNSITADTTVTIALKEKKEASIRLSGSNTTFTYKGITANSDHSNWVIDQEFDTNTNSLSFELIGRLEWTQEHDRELNKLTVSLHDGSTYSLSKKSINIPTTPGQSVETKLTDDLKAIVTKGNETISIGNGAHSYRYSVTFSSEKNIYDDIDISTNFKDATNPELFVTSTAGVSTIACETPNGIQNLDPANSDSNFLGLTSGYKYTFKFSVLSGYIPDASKISVQGTVDGETLDNVQVTKQPDGSLSFEIQTVQGKYDYRIQVVATKSEYKLAYEAKGIDSSSKLNAGEHATITSKKPRKDGYVFNGWTIKGDPSKTIYSSNEVVNIDDLISYSSWDATDGVSKITFEPTWLKADEAKSVGYTVLVHFDDGAPDREYDARTAPNKSVKVFKNELEASLGIDLNKYYLDSDQAFDMENVKDGDVLEVTYHVRKELEVGNLLNVPYNGSTQKLVPNVSAKDNSSLVERKDYTVSYSDGDYTNVTGKNLTVTITGIGKYKGTYPVSYQITKRPVTLKSASLEKVYDGTALVNGDTALETEEGWVDGEGATYSFTGTQTQVGHSPNAFTYTLKNNTKESNYNITKNVGTLTVTKQSIVPDPEHPETYKGITISDPKDKVYNGKDQTWVPEVKDANGNALDASCYTVTYDKDDRTNVTGEIKVTIKGTKNYKGEVTKTYQITKRPVTLKSASLEKVYDGTALVNGDTALETEEGWAEGEGATYSFTGTQTQVGHSPNAFTYTLKNNTTESNYNITKNVGTLTVKAKSIVPDGPDTPEEKKTGITVTKPSDSKYDGEEHKNKPTVTDTKTDKVLVEGTDYELSYSKDVINAGKVTVTVTGIGNYEGSFEVTYEITKRNVTLTSADATKTYDGKALTNTSISVSGDGFVEGEGAEYKVTGTQTQVGNSANEFEYTLNENTLASNYDITKVVGTLTVTAVPAPETPEKPAKSGKVKTGLQTNTGILIVAGTLALAGLGVCVVLARRKRY